MVQTPVYLDNQSTTRVDPRVIEAMLPYFTSHYGNAGSTSHSFGGEARQAVDDARRTIADAINARPREIVFTGGATESNNLAIRGLAERRRRGGSHIVSACTEHKAILDPLARLTQRGFDVTLLPVIHQGHDDAGKIGIDDLARAIRDDTLLVTVMLANNEIGVLQPLAEIADICQQRGVLLHTDATQAVGKMPVDVQQLRVDLMSFSAHKMYGPKGVGALYVRRRGGRVRLISQISGGGQEEGFRSGTLNVPGIVGMAKAVEISLEQLPSEAGRITALRDRLYAGLKNAVPRMALNGPALCPADRRLGGNLNCHFSGVDGEALMMSVRDVAVSSGSACTSANPEPSHVLRALGLDPDDVRGSLRFGVGRFNTLEEIDFTVSAIAEAVHRLRRLAGDNS